MKNHFSTICSATGLVFLSAVAHAGEFATGQELFEMMNGNTLYGGSAYGAFSDYHDPDGTVHGDGFTAKWKIEGDTACVDYGNGYQCWKGRIEGDAAVWYTDGKPSAVSFLVKGKPKE